MGIPLGQVTKGALLQSLGPNRTVLIFWATLLALTLLALTLLATRAPHIRAAARSPVDHIER